MPATDVLSPPAAASPAEDAATGRARAPKRIWGVALFAVLSVFYFAVGTVLVLRYNLFDPDAPSRVANAGYALYSRQPHLSAIGFVWNPLPSLVQIPVLQLSGWWPALKTHGLAAVVQSALFMAGAAVMVRRIALDREVGTWWRRLAVAAFALQPMIIVYGASGMSEAAQAFFLLWCVRHLMRWLGNNWVGDLAWAGIALGLGYLARYEVIPAAFGAALLVAAATFRRSAAPLRDRINSALLAVLIVGFPLVSVFLIWALTGWVVTGELFATLTSQYGNESQVSAAMERGGPAALAASDDWVVIAARVLGMQPFVLVAVALAVALALLRRNIAALAPALVFGGVLAFAAAGQYSSTTFGWFRFYLLAIPLVICVALALWTPAATAAPERRRSKDITARIGAALISLSLVVGIPVTLFAMSDSRIGNQQLQFGFQSLLDPTAHPPEEQWYRRLMVNDRTLAAYFDNRHLPPGSVLMDSFNTWGVWLASDNPKQFVITSDYDFTAVMNRPWDFGIRYIVASNPAISDADALNVRYPQLWDNGAGLGRLVLSVYGATGDERFRVYRFTGKPPVPEEEGPAASRVLEGGVPGPVGTVPGSGAGRDLGRGTPGG